MKAQHYHAKLSCQKSMLRTLNGHTTSNPRRFDVDITWIRRRPNFDEFPRHFRVLFRCNFDGRKIHVVSTYFFRCNFDGRKIHVVSTYFFRCNFDGRKSTLFPRTFVDVILMVKKSTYLLRAFFDVISFIEIPSLSTYFCRRNFDGLIIHFVCTYFFRRNFDEFDVVVGKLLANENIRGGFLLSVTLKSCKIVLFKLLK